MLEIIINQNAINTKAPLTKRIAAILKLESEIEKSNNKLKKKQS